MSQDIGTSVRFKSCKDCGVYLWVTVKLVKGQGGVGVRWLFLPTK